MADTSELLRLCADLGDKSHTIHGDRCLVIRDALKSRLLAEAPEDAEVDDFDCLKAMDYIEQCLNGEGWMDSERANLENVLRALQSRTSQAEAQAPTTAAQASVLTEDEREQLIPLARVADWGGLRDHNSDNLPAEVTVSYPNGIQRTPLSARTFRAFSELFDRLTVGAPASDLHEKLRAWFPHYKDALELIRDAASDISAMYRVGAPAPAPTREQIEAVITAWVERRLTQRFDALLEDKYREGLTEAILALITKGDTP